MRTPIDLHGPCVGMPENSLPTFSSAVGCRIAACLLLACSLFGCSPTTVPEGNETPQVAPLSQGELNVLIGSLANRNERPTMAHATSSIASGKNPLFADDYDWDEDSRVWALSHALQQYNSEELWRCLAEHFDDERYMGAYAIDGTPRIVSLGGECQWLARCYLQAAYMAHLPSSLDGNTPAMKLLTLDGVGRWCRDHAGMPLCQQQAELCEAAIAKIQMIPRVPAADKAKFATDVKRQIDLLLRTRKPALSGQGLLPRHEDLQRYNAQIAKEIKESYVAEQNAGGQGAE